ncbi:MAG: type II toxin-antitoxin system VapC family toxin [Cytophagales bacterium]|nr:type II toxin-antitoxin system VapC family toxin [Cytophagales bacterium]
MTLVDSNILIDLFGKNAQWLVWSTQQLRIAKAQDQLAINAVIYAELSSAFNNASELDRFLLPAGIKVMPISNSASFAAGHAYAAYRKRKGGKTGVLADFFIGAQAQAEGWTLLTRDVARYKTYFPHIKLIHPE